MGTAFSSDTLPFQSPACCRSSSNTSRLARVGGGCQCQIHQTPCRRVGNPDGGSLTGEKGAAKASWEQTYVGGGGDIGDPG